MKIAIDTSPVSKSSTSAHRVRGVGSYINMLVENLPGLAPQNEYVFVEDGKFPLDADVIHYPYFDPFFITLPSTFSKKTIVTVHDLTPLVFPAHFPAGVKGKIRWLIQKSRLKKADIIVVDSDCSGRDVQKIAGIEKSKIHTVYLAADQQFKKLEIGNWKLEIQKRFNLPESFLLYVGDATWNKNIPRLIDAVKKTEFKLVLVGKVWDSSSADVSANPWNKDLKFVLNKIENDPQFMRLGYVADEDLVKIYNLTTATVVPSLYEGFGLPVLEAMNCGCPVISSKGGSLPEVAGGAAYYVDADSEDSITKGISRVMTDEKLRSDLIAKGFTQVKNFSIKKSIESLVGIYEE